MKTDLINIAYFISPHGFGHAARASAVMNALSKVHPALKFHIYSSIPEWFFHSSNVSTFAYHYCVSDVGLVQKTSVTQDISETLKRLSRLYPISKELCQRLGQEIIANQCQAVICDISPLGITVAESIGLPSFLVENFTWDWIYEAYLATSKDFLPYINLLRELFSKATYHIQAIPVCNPTPFANLTVPPISRLPKNPANVTRQTLGIEESQKIVLITMGGVYEALELEAGFSTYPDLVFIIPGSNDVFERSGNIIRLPYHSDFYHPDLVHAAHAVIGKAGYSTLSEAFHAQIPFGLIKRDNFREAPILENFLLENMPSVEISLVNFKDGTWLKQLPALLQAKPNKTESINGAPLIAEFVLKILGKVRRDS